VSSAQAPPPVDANEEVSALIDAVHAIEQRLEELTGGEIDTVVDRVGRPFLLRRARDELRDSETAKQRQNEERLRISESQFRQMAETIDEVFFLQNPDSSQIYYVSPAYERIWGRTCESLYASPMSWADSIHPDDREHAFAQFEAGQNARFDYEFRIVRPDGEVRCIHVRGFPILDEAGNPYRTAGVASDVTRRRRALDELRRSESLKGAILASSLDCLITMDHEGTIVEFNPAAEATFGFTREQAVGKSMVDLIVPLRFRDAHRGDGFARYLADGTPSIVGKRTELAALRADGTEFPIELAVTALGTASTRMFTSCIRDITVRKEADEKIRRLNRVYAVLSGINTQIVRVRDRDGLFREVCRIAVDKGGFRLAWIGVVDRGTEKIVPVTWAGVDEGFLEEVRDRLLLGESRAGHGPTAIAIRTGGPVVVNNTATDPRIGHRDAHVSRGLCSFVSLPLLIGNEVVAVLDLHAGEVEFFDEAEMLLLRELAGNISFALAAIEKEEKLNYLAYYDALTGLANRSLFLERVAQYMRGAASDGHSLAVFLIDLERFKNINDSLGQAAGDSLLRQVAEWLKNNAGDGTVLSRIGSDHFAVVLPKVRPDGDIGRLIEKTMGSFGEHAFRVDDAVFRIAARVGVALFPEHGSSADVLLKNAEAALKKAKATGERYLMYTQTMTETVAVKLTLENRLRQALDKEEFVLHYQPKLSFTTGKLAGAEALIRWNDPRTGLVVPPGLFIPLLEETGLIYEVGRWALRKAIEDYLRWRTAGLAAVRIAVNVSPRQLRHRSFLAEIRAAIDIDLHAAAGLELEITESMVMGDVKHSIAVLQAIRAMKVRIAIDDFGTGFSSLSYLAKLPVDTLKIDRSFVTEMTAEPEGLALVATIINLAHSLRLCVVAEGVETEEQSRLLRLLNCDEMQGFLYSKPLPAEVFETRFLVPALSAN